MAVLALKLVTQSGVRLVSEHALRFAWFYPVMRLGSGISQEAVWTFILGVLALVVGILAVWLARKTRVLYGLRRSTPLINASPIGKPVVVTVDGRLLHHPHYVEVQLVTRGRDDIHPDRFTGRPIVLDLGAPIHTVLAVPRVEPDTADKPGVTWVERTLEIHPFLMKSRERVTLSVLTDGQPHLTWPLHNLSNVRLKQFAGPEPPVTPWPWWVTSALGTAFILLAIIGSVVQKAAPQIEDDGWWEVITTGIAWLFILWIASAIVKGALWLFAKRPY